MILNHNTETGIPYGILSLHDAPDWLLDEAEPESVLVCPECGADADADADEGDTCPVCRTGELNWIETCYSTFEIRDGADFCNGFIDEMGDVWITHSSHVVEAPPCSPCAPGARYVGTPQGDPFRPFRAGATLELDRGPVGYCFPPSFF